MSYRTAVALLRQSGYRPARNEGHIIYIRPGCPPLALPHQHRRHDLSPRLRHLVAEATKREARL